MPQYGIDSTEEMHTSFRELAEELGIYDSEGKITEYGRTAWGGRYAAKSGGQVYGRGRFYYFAL